MYNVFLYYRYVPCRDAWHLFLIVFDMLYVHSHTAHHNTMSIVILFHSYYTIFFFLTLQIFYMFDMRLAMQSRNRGTKGDGFYGTERLLGINLLVIRDTIILIYTFFMFLKPILFINVHVQTVKYSRSSFSPIC